MKNIGKIYLTLIIWGILIGISGAFGLRPLGILSGIMAMVYL